MNSTTSIFPENHCPELTFRDRLVQPVSQWHWLHGSGRSASSSGVVLTYIGRVSFWERYPVLGTPSFPHTASVQPESCVWGINRVAFSIALIFGWPRPKTDTCEPGVGSNPKFSTLVQAARFICGVNLKSKIDWGMWGRCNTVLLIEGCHTSIPHWYKLFTRWVALVVAISLI